MSLQAFLKNRWSQSGLKKNENILLHSSFKRTFNDLKEEGYKFNPEDILDSLLDLVTPDGTLVLPTFNFDFNTIEKYLTFSYKNRLLYFENVEKLQLIDSLNKATRLVRKKLLGYSSKKRSCYDI